MVRLHAQISMEFLMVSGVAMLILAAGSMFLYNYTASAEDNTAVLQLANLGYELVDQARSVYVYGEDSFVTIEANIPTSVREIYVVENDTLVLTLVGSDGFISLPVFSDIPINGTFESGNKVHVNNATQNVHGGRSTFRVTSQGSWVQISQVS